MTQFDCKHFKQNKPCDYLKNSETNNCDSKCTFYQKIDKHILIACLGAYGDVLSHTSLFKHFPAKDGWQIHFLTLKKMAPILENLDCKVYYFDEPHTHYSLEQIKFDIVFSVEKDVNLVQYLSRFYATYRYVYNFNGERLYSTSHNLQHELNLGWDDELFRKETSSRYSRYVSILELRGQDDKPVVRAEPKKLRVLQDKKTIGIQCRTSDAYCINRSLSFQQHIDLIVKLRRKGYDILLLGGEKEKELNTKLIKESAIYLQDYLPSWSHLPIGIASFTDLDDISYSNLCAYMAGCDIIITPDTLHYHIAKGLDKNTIVYYGPSKHNDFECSDNIIKIIHNRCGCFLPKEADHKCLDNFDINRIVRAINDC